MYLLISRFPGFLFFAITFFLSFPLFSYSQQSDNTVSSPQDIDQGFLLFSGIERFSNGGPSCISCHTLQDADLPVSGGTYGIDITGFAGLPVDALMERIIEVPFPHMAVMKSAFVERPVTETESMQIIAYLKDVAESQPEANIHPPLNGIRLLWAGLEGTFLIFALIILLWRKRKRNSVNHSIYQRQIQSV